MRPFLAASFQSSIGNAIGYIALLLLAYDMTRSAWAVSAVLLAEFVPAIALGPLFGALADRCSRRTLVVTADLLRCAAFVALAFAGSLPALIGLALVAGVGGALYQPAAKSALPGLAGEHADRAMAALVASWSAAGMIGPGLGAGLLVVMSSADLMLVNAATFLLSAIVLGRLPLDGPPRTAASPDAPVPEDGGRRPRRPRRPAHRCVACPGLARRRRRRRRHHAGLLDDERRRAAARPPGARGRRRRLRPARLRLRRRLHDRRAARPRERLGDARRARRRRARAPRQRARAVGRRSPP